MDSKSDSKNVQYVIPQSPDYITMIDRSINFLKWISGYEQIRNQSVGTILSVSCNYDLNGNKTIEWFIRKDENNRYTHITSVDTQTKEITYDDDFYR